MRRQSIAAAGLLLCTAAAPARNASLTKEVAGFASAAGGRVGVAALLVETGERLAYHGDERFPMQSVFKLPAALHVLHLVDEGGVRLRDTVTIRPRDMSPEHSPIAERWPDGVTLTIEDLLERMVSDSDNTAADTLLRLTGGPRAVTKRLRALAVSGIRVDRGERQLTIDLLGVIARPPDPWWTRAEFDRIANAVPLARQRAAYARYERDPRDTATPNGAVALLARLARGDELAPPTHALLMNWLTSTATGPNRIKGLLPAGTTVAHKTGTADAAGMNAATNDIGLVTMKDGRHLAIAVLMTGSSASIGTRERTIAQIARAVYDAWSAR